MNTQAHIRLARLPHHTVHTNEILCAHITPVVQCRVPTEKPSTGWYSQESKKPRHVFFILKLVHCTAVLVRYVRRTHLSPPCKKSRLLRPASLSLFLVSCYCCATMYHRYLVPGMYYYYTTAVQSIPNFVLLVTLSLDFLVLVFLLR